ncbi:hypothetical protein C5167_011039 [Papaver somniferum]|uniref:LysM domain-containing protein n=1 Tax=Papaver somniferum TaxID=3469 RepID=A0A4Y7K565_PAPSO|nr:lysM domain-containing GPI-anchored protein 2-like isoform X2 [Papaver somniferum]RZC67351.1 hypothetical protein C5167_011039 [Papaver somniferum]
MLLSKFLFCILLFFVLTFSSAESLGFTCKSNTTSKCKSLAGYVSPNATTLSSIVSLFGITDFNSLLGANNLPIRTKPSRSVAAKETIKIPFTCSCNNGTGISDKGPIYKVQSGESLYHIATDLFGFLVTTDEIAAVNNISNPDLIDVDQLLRIPLPCNCDDVDGNRVLHYAYKVSPNKSLEMIAKEFGATEESLLILNNLTDAKQLEAESILDVPLRVCTSMIRNTSADYPLLLPNGTYTFTANNCVKCSCDSSGKYWETFLEPKNWTLYCEPSPPEVKVRNWKECPTTTCVKEIEPGNNWGVQLGMSIFDSRCSDVEGKHNEWSCAYTGYNSRRQTVSVYMVNETRCIRGPSSGSSKMSTQSSNLVSFLINFGLLLCSALISS